MNGFSGRDTCCHPRQLWIAPVTIPSVHQALEARVEKLTLVPHLLPRFVQQLADLLGLRKALQISLALEGLEILIPSVSMGKGARGLSSVLGSEELTEDLIAACGGERIYLPRCVIAECAVRDIEIHRAAELGLKSGKSMNSIVDILAKEHRLSARRIWGILKKPLATLQHSPTGDTSALPITLKTNPGD